MMKMSIVQKKEAKMFFKTIPTLLVKKHTRHCYLFEWKIKVSTIIFFKLLYIFYYLGNQSVF